MIATMLGQLQRQLFPVLAEEIGVLSDLDRQFCAVIALTDLGRFTSVYDWCGNGAPPPARVWLAHAFIAKSVSQFPTTTALLAALRSQPTFSRRCGWESRGELPSEPTFSRAFAAFAEQAVAAADSRTPGQDLRRPEARRSAQPRCHGHRRPRTAGPQAGPGGRRAAQTRSPKERRDPPTTALEATGVARAAHAGGQLGRSAQRLRRRDQVPQQGLQDQLDWLQTSPRHRPTAICQ